MKGNGRKPVVFFTLPTILFYKYLRQYNDQSWFRCYVFRNMNVNGDVLVDEFIFINL